MKILSIRTSGIFAPLTGLAVAGVMATVAAPAMAQSRVNIKFDNRMPFKILLEGKRDHAGFNALDIQRNEEPESDSVNLGTIDAGSVDAATTRTLTSVDSELTIHIYTESGQLIDAWRPPGRSGTFSYGLTSAGVIIHNRRNETITVLDKWRLQLDSEGKIFGKSYANPQAFTLAPNQSIRMLCDAGDELHFWNGDRTDRIDANSYVVPPGLSTHSVDPREPEQLPHASMKRSVVKSRPYNQNTFLMAHNAYASPANGYKFDVRKMQPSWANQGYSIPLLLKNYGVRALELDVHLCRGELWVFHDLSEITGGATCDSDFGDHVLLRDVLVDLVQFLEDEPSEILTVFIESHDNTTASLNDLYYQALLDSRALSLLVWPTADSMVPAKTFHGPRPSDPGDRAAYDRIFNNFNLAEDRSNPGYPNNKSVVYTQNWPTMDEMKTEEKRLVMFVSRNDQLQHVLPYTWKYTRENQFARGVGITPPDVERNESDPNALNKVQFRFPGDRPLFLLNHTHLFLTQFFHSQINSEYRILFAAKSYAKHFGHIPNFISLDYASSGTAPDAIDKLNACWGENDPLRTLEDLKVPGHKDDI